MNPTDIGLVGVDGLSRLQEFGAIVTILTIIIAGLIWDRQRILKQLQDTTDKFITSAQANGDKFANVVIQNTQAITEFKDTLKDVARQKA